MEAFHKAVLPRAARLDEARRDARRPQPRLQYPGDKLAAIVAAGAGFLVLVPEDKVTKLDMSVADGIKYIISLGSISPEYAHPTKS